MLVEQALAQAVTLLRNEGVDSPRLDAELLLAHILGANRAAVLARPERRLTPRQLTRYWDLVARRAEREPLAYIVGQREFYGLSFAVDRRVLIPRPETELLVERALQVARLRGGGIQIADVGAGSGAIAVTLAVHLPQATIYALDESSGALAVTAGNARRHGVEGRVHCLHGDLFAPLKAPVDLVTANLPYVALDEWQALPPEIRVYEPRVALDGGTDGLDLIRSLLAAASSHLQPGGVLLLEIGARQGNAVTTLAQKYLPQATTRLLQDYAGLDRLVEIRFPNPASGGLPPAGFSSIMS
jgi:release factor glutamine methyltransferase